MVCKQRPQHSALYAVWVKEKENEHGLLKQTNTDKSSLRSYHHFHGENQFHDHNKEQRVPRNSVKSLPRSKQRSLAMYTRYHLQLCEEKTSVQVARDLRVQNKAGCIHRQVPHSCMKAPLATNHLLRCGASIRTLSLGVVHSDHAK